MFSTEREARADGEAQHRGIDEESDPPAGQQETMKRRLERFLGHRRDVARQHERREPCRCGNHAS